LVGYSRGGPAAYGWDGFSRAEFLEGAGELDEEVDIAEELEGCSLGRCGGWFGVCGMGDVRYTVRDEAG